MKAHVHNMGDEPLTEQPSSIPEHPSSEDRPSTGARNLTTASSMRTWHWPFQSSISHSRRPSGAQHSRTGSSAQLSSRSTSFGRRLSAGWGNLRPASSVLGSDIVPDYVVNYMRGETPESLARKREMAGNPHTPEFERGDGTASQQADYLSLRTNSRLFVGDVEELGSRGSGRSLLRRIIGGRTGGILLSASLAGAILLGLVVCVALAATRGIISLGSETVFEGNCEKVRAVDQGIHAALMVFAFVLIAGANYISQVLVSPTREEVDAAHQQQDWLDIGIPSMRNLLRIGKGRAALAVLMVISSTASLIM